MIGKDIFAIVATRKDRTGSDQPGARRVRAETVADCFLTGLYTDESPGLKVDPVVVLVLSLGFIFSVVALHSEC